MTNILVPTLGESVTEATVATWFKTPGESIRTDEMLCELETDKVTVEVPSPVSGILKEISAPEGSTVGLNALLAIVDEHSNDAQPNGDSSEESIKDKNSPSKQKEVVEEIGHAPAARKLMQE